MPQLGENFSGKEGNKRSNSKSGETHYFMIKQEGKDGEGQNTVKLKWQAFIL